MCTGMNPLVPLWTDAASLLHWRSFDLDNLWLTTRLLVLGALRFFCTLLDCLTSSPMMVKLHTDMLTTLLCGLHQFSGDMHQPLCNDLSRALTVLMPGWAANGWEWSSSWGLVPSSNWTSCPRTSYSCRATESVSHGPSRTSASPSTAS